MAPTECFKSHDIPFRREKTQKVKETRLMWSSPSTSPGTPMSSWPTLQHLGWGPWPTASWSPVSMEMETPWW